MYRNVTKEKISQNFRFYKLIHITHITPITVEGVCIPLMVVDLPPLTPEDIAALTAENEK